MLSKYPMYMLLGCSLLGSSLTMATVSADNVPVKSKMCAGCHGVNGISPSPTIPNLAGQKRAYLIREINDYRSGDRTDPMMSKVAKALNDDDVEELAEYFSKLRVAED
jgi:cytochrome c553